MEWSKVPKRSKTTGSARTGLRTGTRSRSIACSTIIRRSGWLPRWSHIHWNNTILKISTPLSHFGKSYSATRPSSHCSGPSIQTILTCSQPTTMIQEKSWARKDSRSSTSQTGWANPFMAEKASVFSSAQILQMNLENKKALTSLLKWPKSTSAWTTGRNWANQFIKQKQTSRMPNSEWSKLAPGS